MMDKKEKFLKKLVQIPHLNLTQYIKKVKLNEMLFDYWLTELCDENDELIPAKCSEEILSQLEKDVYDNEV